MRIVGGLFSVIMGALVKQFTKGSSSTTFGYTAPTCYSIVRNCIILHRSSEEYPRILKYLSRLILSQIYIPPTDRDKACSKLRTPKSTGVNDQCFQCRKNISIALWVGSILGPDTIGAWRGSLRGDGGGLGEIVERLRGTSEGLSPVGGPLGSVREPKE